MFVFQWFRCFAGSPLFEVSFWPLAGLLLAFSWHLAGFPARASCQSTPPEQSAKAPRQSTPPELASCWPLAGLFLASCWPLAGFLLASCRLPRQSIPPENRFFKEPPKLVNSLHENACFSMVSVFRGVPPHLGPLPGLLLASCWPLPGFLLCWLPRQSIPPENPAPI